MTKPTKKIVKKLNTAQKKQRRQDRLRLVLGVSLILIVGSASTISYMHFGMGKPLPFKNLFTQEESIEAVAARQKAEADKIFRNYLVKMVSATYLETTSDYSLIGTDTKMSGQTIYDSEHKQLVSALEMQCTVQSGNVSVKLNASMQTDAKGNSVRINSVMGSYNDANGRAVDLATKYRSTIGVWYGSANDNALQAQIDNGVFVSAAGVIAPTSDPQAVVNALLSNQAIEYSMNGLGDNGIYTYSLKANKSGLVTAMKQAFPNISNSDLIAESVFGSGSSDVTEVDATITVKADGTLISEESMPGDPCQSLAGGIVGLPETFNTITEHETAVTKGTVKIAPATNIRPISEFERAIR